MNVFSKKKSKLVPRKKNISFFFNMNEEIIEDMGTRSTERAVHTTLMQH